MSLFPVFLKLEGRPCLVVGAGEVGESKVAGLLAAQARVRVVAPEATATLQEWALAGRVDWAAREFEPADLEGAALVVVATSSPDLNARVFRLARERRVLCNVVDDPAHCDFYYPAIVRRGDLQIAISTGGRSPALAQRLRQELEEQFAPEYADWLEALGRARDELRARDDLDAETRRRLLHFLARPESFEEFRSGRPAEAHGGSAPGEEGPAGTAHPAAPRARRAPGKVYLVGAGPGDPDLLTVRAARRLRSADVVLHDDLVPRPVIELASPRARVMNVGKRCGRRRITQEEIHALMIGFARQGLTVVRLKGGDPLTFGRAGEEVRALRQAGVELEIVAGVTAASAAAAVAGISLTERRRASSVIFITGHHCAERSGRPRGSESGLAGGKLPPKATIVVYMPGDDLGPLAAELRAAGLLAETPCLMVSRLAAPDQQFRRTTLEGLGRAAPLPSPKLLIIGAVAGTADEGRAETEPEPELVTASAE